MHARLLGKQAAVDQLRRRVEALALEVAVLAAAQGRPAGKAAMGVLTGPAVPTGDSSAAGGAVVCPLGEGTALGVDEARAALEAALAAAVDAQRAARMAAGEVDVAEGRSQQLLVRGPRLVQVVVAQHAHAYAPVAHALTYAHQLGIGLVGKGVPCCMASLVA